MKKNIILAVLLCCTAFVAQAQESLVGRVYYNKNIMEKMLDEAFEGEDIEKKIVHMRDSAFLAAEQKKGRKLTAEEKDELNKEVEKAQKLIEAMKKGMSTAITVEFKTETQMVMKMDMKMDDDVLKAAGVPWAKRKLMKAAMAIMPAQKATYERQGNLIIATDDKGKDKDTLTLNADGKSLSGWMDEKTPFTLTRIK